MEREEPEWFRISNEAFRPIHERIAKTLQANDLPLNLSFVPQQALWFFVGSMHFASEANKEGMHANAICQTRQCIEALSVIDVGICRHPERESTLESWRKGKLKAGELRKWLADHLWPSYGTGLWTEDWQEFMSQLAGAVQQYAHYTPELAQWQERLHSMDIESGHGLISVGPKLYDPQKATRITLYHAILNYALARAWLAQDDSADASFSLLIQRLGSALSKSKYLDGHGTNWKQQFWAMTWKKDGSPILE